MLSAHRDTYKLHYPEERNLKKTSMRGAMIAYAKLTALLQGIKVSRYQDWVYQVGENSKYSYILNYCTLVSCLPIVSCFLFLLLLRVNHAPSSY